MSVALTRIRVAIEEVGELSASLAPFQRASVTLFRQSTHVPKTSKKSALGFRWSSAMLCEVMYANREGIGQLDGEKTV